MSGDYRVGYGRPPWHTRFRPGQSGNPAGRPKVPQTLASDLREELEEMITLGDGDAERTVSRQRAILASLTAKALEGDPKAIAMVLDLVQRMAAEEPGEDILFGETTRQRLARKIERLAASMEQEGPDAGDGGSPAEPRADQPAPEPGP